MIRVLSVDDQPLNHKLLELDIEDFMIDKKLEYKFYSANNGLDAIKKIKVIKPDIIFMDIMMPIITGIETIRCLKVLDNINNPKIIVVTALGDKKTQQNAKDAGANGFIVKPFQYEAMEILLTRYLSLENIDNKVNSELENDDSFFDFDDDLVNDVQDLILEQLDKFNKSHLKINALSFLQEYKQIEIDYLISDINEIEENIREKIDILYSQNLDEEKNQISEVLLRYANFLNYFDNFRELSTTINLLIRHFENVNYSNLNEKKADTIAKFIIEILHDLISWKEHVFVKKDAVDVYYINASMFNSCIQLESLLKE